MPSCSRCNISWTIETVTICPRCLGLDSRGGNTEPWGCLLATMTALAILVGISAWVEYKYDPARKAQAVGSTSEPGPPASAPAARRLAGSWEAPPPAVIPQTLTLNADGTGMDASGVGNFRIRWEEVGSAASPRLRVTYTGASVDAFGREVRAGFRPDDWEEAVEVLGPDAIRVRGAELRRAK